VKLRILFQDKSNAEKNYSKNDSFCGKIKERAGFCLSAYLAPDL
jgi:hypothetical protein